MYGIHNFVSCCNSPSGLFYLLCVCVLLNNRGKLFERAQQAIAPETGIAFSFSLLFFVLVGKIVKNDFSIPRADSCERLDGLSCLSVREGWARYKWPGSL